MTIFHTDTCTWHLFFLFKCKFLEIMSFSSVICVNIYKYICIYIQQAILNCSKLARSFECDKEQNEKKRKQERERKIARERQKRERGAMNIIYEHTFARIIISLSLSKTLSLSKNGQPFKIFLSMFP